MGMKLATKSDLEGGFLGLFRLLVLTTPWVLLPGLLYCQQTTAENRCRTESGPGLTSYDLTKILDDASNADTLKEHTADQMNELRKKADALRAEFAGINQD